MLSVASASFSVLSLLRSSFFRIYSLFIFAWRLIELVKAMKGRAVVQELLIIRMIAATRHLSLLSGTPNITATGSVISDFPQCFFQGMCA